MNSFAVLQGPCADLRKSWGIVLGVIINKVITFKDGMPDQSSDRLKVIFSIPLKTHFSRTEEE